MTNKQKSNSTPKRKVLKESMDFRTAKEILIFSGYHFAPGDDSILYKFLDHMYKYGVGNPDEPKVLDDLSDDEFRKEFENFKYEYEGNEDSFDEFDSDEEELNEMTTDVKHVKFPGRHSIKEEDEETDVELNEMTTDEEKVVYPGRHSIKEEEDELEEGTRAERKAATGSYMKIYEDEDEEEQMDILDDCYDHINEEEDGLSHEVGEDMIHESYLNEEKFLLQDVDDMNDDEDEMNINEKEENDEEGEDVDIETPYSEQDIQDSDHMDDDIDIDSEVREGPNMYSKVEGASTSNDSFSLQDLKSIVKSIMGEMNQNPDNYGNASESLIDITPDNSIEFESVDDFEDEDTGTPNILDTEFRENDENISNIQEDEDESYLDKINGVPEHVGVDGNVARGEKGLMQSSDEIEEEDYDPDLEIVEPVDAGYEDSDEELNDDDLNEVENGDFSVPGNKKIKVIIQGWMITEGEIKYLHKVIKENGGLLRAVKSNNKKILYVLVEANKKFHTIRYDDRSQYETVTPWTIKNKKFLSLKEAIRAIKSNSLYKKKISDKEKYFRKLVQKDNLMERRMSDVEDASIFEDFRNKTNYVPSWNMKSVGMLNLKNGLNEHFSKITQHTPEIKNTLFQTKDGNYYVIKGNISEASKVGTKRHLCDFENKKDYGVGKIVGIYENSMQGLGRIMEKIKRTSVTLLVWR